MRRGRPAGWALVSLVAALLALGLPALAGANAYTTVSAAFKAHGGTIPSCEFPAPTLIAALKQTPTQGQQYDAEFPGAIQQALSSEDGGVCAKQRHGLAPRSGVVGFTDTGRSALPGSPTASSDAGTPLAIVLLAVLALLLAGGAATTAIVRRGGSESPALTDWRHACAEAEYRITGRWADLADRRRRGRPARRS